MNVEIAQRLAELRRAKGYSQEALARELGLSRQAISKWERAESSPDTDNLIALARLYGMSLDELLRVGSEAEENAVPATEPPVKAPEPTAGRNGRAKVVVMGAIIVVLLSLLAWLLVTGVWRRVMATGSNETFSLGSPFDKSAVYTASGVRNLDVTWQGGTVRVERGTSEKVSVRASLPAGTYDMDPTRVSIRMRDDGTLVVDDGLPEADNGLDYPDLQLIIQLPADDVMELGQVRISGVVSDAELSGFVCQTFALEGVSGNVDVLLPAVEKNVVIEKVSGHVTLALADGMPDETHVRTVSGDVTLDVPEGVGMTLRFDTTSGGFSDAVGSDSVDAGVLTYGDGAANVTVSAVSGSLRVQ